MSTAQSCLASDANRCDDKVNLAHSNTHIVDEPSSGGPPEPQRGHSGHGAQERLREQHPRDKSISSVVMQHSAKWNGEATEQVSARRDHTKSSWTVVVRGWARLIVRRSGRAQTRQREHADRCQPAQTPARGGKTDGEALVQCTHVFMAGKRPETHSSVDSHTVDLDDGPQSPRSPSLRSSDESAPWLNGTPIEHVVLEEPLLPPPAKPPGRPTG